MKATDNETSTISNRTRRPWTVLGVWGSACLITGVAILISSPRGSSHQPHAGARLISSTNAICPPAAFCVSGPNPGPTIYPGDLAQPLPVTFINPYAVPITISSVRISFTNTFPANCSASAFTVTGPSASGSMPNFVVEPNITVDKASTLTYKGIGLALVDQGNQNACHGLQLAMNLIASATYDYTNCVTGSQGGGTVASGQVVCVAKGGKLTGGVTVQSGGVLYVNGGTISGSLNASYPAGINLCSATVSGSSTISGATGEVVIGDGQSCAGGTFSGGLSVTNGTGGVQIIGNSITGGLTVAGNSGSIAGPGVVSGQFVAANSITGGFTCTPNNTPALSDNPTGTSVGEPNSVKGSRTGGQCQGTF